MGWIVAGAVCMCFGFPFIGIVLIIIGICAD